MDRITYFARFDIAAIEKNICEINGSIYCTKIASKLTRTYTDFHGLKELCNELVGVNLSKAQQSSNWSSEELSHAQK